MFAGLPGVSWHASNQQQPKNDRLELFAAFEAISMLQEGDWSLDAVITGLTLLSCYPSSEAAKLAGDLFVSSVEEKRSLAAALREAVHAASWLSSAHRKGLLRVVMQVQSVAGVHPDSSEEDGETKEGGETEEAQGTEARNGCQDQEQAKKHRPEWSRMAENNFKQAWFKRR